MPLAPAPSWPHSEWHRSVPFFNKADDHLSEGEVVELSKVIGALLINFGTVTHEQVAGMLAAGKAANQNKKPLIFDPVGIGATTLRKELGLKDLMNQWQATVIKGNAGEISTVAGSTEVSTSGTSWRSTSLILYIDRSKVVGLTRSVLASKTRLRSFELSPSVNVRHFLLFSLFITRATDM